MEFRRATYLLIVFAGLAAGLGVSQYRRGIFACPAQGYEGNRYLAYCAGSRYGDYDHGAFWFDMEPEAQRHAASADVLLLGNSRLIAALSTRQTAEWFATASHSYYLMGFMFWNTVPFTGDVLHKLKPRAKLYVINIDHFFESTTVGPAQFVMTDPEALSRYKTKRRWQPVHRMLCGSISALCGDRETWFRSIDTGAFLIHTEHTKPGLTNDNLVVDELDVSNQVALAKPFLASLGVPRSCIVFTLAPYPNAPTATGKAIAAALGVTFVAPRPDNMATFDGAHLNVTSAVRWSEDFYREAGSAMKSCLDAAGNT